MRLKVISSLIYNYLQRISTTIPTSLFFSQEYTILRRITEAKVERVGGRRSVKYDS